MGESEETANYTLWESICHFSPACTDKFPMESGSSKDKFDEFSELRGKKGEIIEEIKAHNDTLRSIQLAERLDKDLPEPAKKNNGYVLEIKKEYNSFFGPDSGNNSIKDSLDEVKEYVNSEKNHLKSELSKVNVNIQNLLSESNKEDEESKNPSKRTAASEPDADTQLSSKKTYRSDDNSNNTSDPSQSGKDHSESTKDPSESTKYPSESIKDPSKSDQSSFNGDDGGSLWDFF